jgi:hypothetical protein
MCSYDTRHLFSSSRMHHVCMNSEVVFGPAACMRMHEFRRRSHVLSRDLGDVTGKVTSTTVVGPLYRRLTS